MDDQKQNNQQPIGSVSAQQPVQSSGTDIFQAGSHAPPAPVSIPYKEQGPAFTGGVQLETSEFIHPSEIEPVLHPEVEGAGVETVSQSNISQLAKQIGAEAVKENTPVETEPVKFMKLPMTSGNAKQIASQKGRFRDSILWLAMLILRQIKMSKFKQNMEKKDAK